MSCRRSSTQRSDTSGVSVSKSESSQSDKPREAMGLASKVRAIAESIAMDGTEEAQIESTDLRSAAQMLESFALSAGVAFKGWRYEPLENQDYDPGQFPQVTKFWGRVLDENGKFISHIGTADAEALLSTRSATEPMIDPRMLALIRVLDDLEESGNGWNPATMPHNANEAERKFRDMLVSNWKSIRRLIPIRSVGPTAKDATNAD